MFENQILSPAQKIKKIRESLGVTQQELCGEEVNRGLYSRIETEKANLTPAYAEKIAEKINEVASKMNESLTITGEELLESEAKQAERIIKNRIEALKVIPKRKEQEQEVASLYKSIETLFQQYEVAYPVEFEFYKLISEFYYALYKFDYARKAAYRCVMLSVRHYEKQLILQAFLLLMRIYIMKEEYTQVVSLGEMVPSLVTEEVDQDLLKRIYFNDAVANYRIHNYSRCIDVLDKLTETFNLSLSESLDIEIMKASCAYFAQDYGMAERKYKEILELAIHFNDNDKLAISHKNLAGLYLKQGLVYIARQHIEKALSVEGITNNIYIADIYYQALEIAVIQDDCKGVEVYYRKALKEAIEIGNAKMQDDIMNIVLNFYIDGNFNSELTEFLEVLEEDVLAKKVLSHSLAHIFSKAAYYFKNIDKCLSEQIYDKQMEIVKMLEQKCKKDVFYR